MRVKGVVSIEAYDSLVRHLRDGTRPSADDRQHSALANHIYKHLQRYDYELRKVHDPRSCSKDRETKLVLAGTSKIVLKEERF